MYFYKYIIVTLKKDIKRLCKHWFIFVMGNLSESVRKRILFVLQSLIFLFDKYPPCYVRNFKVNNNLKMLLLFLDKKNIKRKIMDWKTKYLNHISDE